MRSAHRAPDKWVAVEVSLPPVDPLAVASQWDAWRLYWERPEKGEAFAGFGVADEVIAHDASELPRALAKVGERLGLSSNLWFGGLAFSAEPDKQWPGFPVGRWVLPEVLVMRTGNISRAVVLGRSESAARVLAEQVKEKISSFRLEAVAPPAPAPAKRLEAGDAHQSWTKLVERALAEIEAKKFEKVVLARSLVLANSDEFSVPQALAKLRTRFPSCAIFLCAFEGSGSFLGATPETLCRVQGASLQTEALAGSSKPEHAARLPRQLKEGREHRLVVEGIRDALMPLADSIEAAQAPSVVTLPNVAHLKTPIRATLRPGTTAVHVLRALHPTPAVGGFPRKAALEFLSRHEGLHRGWYAGAIGWLGSGGADLAVALRSALIEGNRARLFVGAGIVQGSDAAAEWEETEAKAQPMLEALGGAA